MRVTLVGFLLLACVSPALALWGDSDEALGLDGSIRGLGSLIDTSRLLDEGGTDGYFQGILRLTAMGRPSDRVSYELHLVQSYTHSSTPGASSAIGVGATLRDLPYRAVDTSWEWWNNDSASALLWLDRFSAKVGLGWGDLTVGRQAVTFGKAYFWNPMDVFLPFDPNQFDRDYKAGVDAVRVDIPVDAFAGFTGIAVFGRKVALDGRYVDDGGAVAASWYGSALMGRYYTNTSGWDLAFQGGKIYGGYQVGGGATGEIGPLEARMEATWFWAMGGSEMLPAPLEGDLYEDYGTLVLGIGRYFPNSLQIEAEYLYNGASDPDDLAASFVRYANGATLHIGRHLFGALASYQFRPIVFGQAVVLYSLSDSSFYLQPIVTLSLSDDSDLVMGAAVSAGERPVTMEDELIPRSEFGSYPNSLFAQVKWYF